jgi:hypothetical protein
LVPSGLIPVVVVPSGAVLPPLGVVGVGHVACTIPGSFNILSLDPSGFTLP